MECISRQRQTNIGASTSDSRLSKKEGVAALLAKREKQPAEEAEVEADKVEVAAAEAEAEAEAH